MTPSPEPARSPSPLYRLLITGSLLALGVLCLAPRVPVANALVHGFSAAEWRPPTAYPPFAAILFTPAAWLLGRCPQGRARPGERGPARPADLVVLPPRGTAGPAGARPGRNRRGAVGGAAVPEPAARPDQPGAGLRRRLGPRPAARGTGQGLRAGHRRRDHADPGGPHPVPAADRADPDRPDRTGRLQPAPACWACSSCRRPPPTSGPATSPWGAGPCCRSCRTCGSGAFRCWRS